MRRNGKPASSSGTFATLISRVVMVGVALLLVTSAKLWMSAVSHASGSHDLDRSQEGEDTWIQGNHAHNNESE